MINDPDEIATICGAAGPMSFVNKGPVYFSPKETQKCYADSLHTIPTMSEHARRRKDWDAAFSVTALKGYEQRIVESINLIISQIWNLGKEGELIEVGRWASWFGFDVMAESDFGQSFGMIKEGKTVEAIEVGRRGGRTAFSSCSVLLSHYLTSNLALLLYTAHRIGCDSHHGSKYPSQAERTSLSFRHPLLSPPSLMHASSGLNRLEMFPT